MPSVVQIAQMRARRREKEHRHPLSRTGLGCSGVFSLALALTAILIALLYSQITQDIPSVEGLPALLEPPNGLLLKPTRLYDRSGQHVILELQNPAAAARRYLRLPGTANEGEPVFSEPMIVATLAAADPNFWRHWGFSLRGLFNGGHPTLAQQLVSDLLLDDEPPSLRRALRERLLAAQLTQRFGREKTLEWYLNSAYYGRLAYGADAAALVYFGKSAADVDLAEAALIAASGLDATLNPQDAPQYALGRQKIILQNVLRYRLAAPQEAAQAAQRSLDIRPALRPGQALSLEDLQPKIAPAFARIVLQQIESRIPRKRLERGGMLILTSLDYELQIQMICILAAQAEKLGVPAIEMPATEGCTADRLLPALEGRRIDEKVYAQALVLDPQSGHILALVNAAPSTPSGELLAAHPAGTLATPFIYLTAFTRGLGPASLVWDIPPEGAQDLGAERLAEYHGPVRLRLALANDYRQPAEQLLAQVGVENVWRTAQQFGVLSPQNLVDGEANALSFLRPVNLIEMSQAFGVLANQGVLVGHMETPVSAAPDSAAPVSADASLTFGSQPPPIQPVAALRVEDVAGKIWLDWSIGQTRPIVAAPLAYLVTHALSDETARWPSLGHPNPLEIGRPAAAKVGRGDPSEHSAWVIGYTPERLVGVWLGYAATANPPDEIVAQAAMGVYHAAMKYANQDLPVRPWPTPAGIVSLKVCDPSGMLPTVFCPNVVEEVFLSGNEPLQPDRLYQSAAINRETGRLATIFTPPDLIVDQPYMMIPPQAKDWARQTGLSSPPDTYDTLTALPPPSSQVQITSPAMFEIVRGALPIRGSVQLEDLSFYRLQIGQGLNPQGWYQIGKDNNQPIKEGLLGVWDTHGLNGLYVIELLAVRADQSVQRAVVLVTVDNQPPTLKIISPVQQEEITLRQRPNIVLLAEATDDLGAATVEFYLDNRLLASISQPPYALSWQCVRGAHTLRVRAVDQAGNVTEDTLQFTVQ